MQALIAIGGRATRLRADGVDVPVSKSFLHFQGRALLHWCLLSLHKAGIRDLILCADDAVQEDEASQILSDLPWIFSNVRFFRDEGKGVHGLPFYARALLDESFIFECGHNITPSAQYEAMDKKKDDRNVVFSLYKAHPLNRRYPVDLVRGRVKPSSEADGSMLAFAHPLLIDHDYIRKLPTHNYDFVGILNEYISRRQLKFVLSAVPPEFDIADEEEKCFAEYRARGKLPLA